MWKPCRIWPHGGPPPPLFFVFMPVLWLGIMFLWVVNVIVGVMGALKSNDGHWWRYPIAGRLAEKFLEVEGSASRRSPFCSR